MPESALQKYTVPAAIIGAGLFIAIAVYLYNDPPHFAFFGAPAAKISTFDPPSPDDHLIGNPGAPIKIIEYCDIAAPYCVQFQAVMNSVMAQYGSSGQIAWIYRHFPLNDIDANEHQNAVASECAAAEGGSEAFFGFINAVATTTKNVPDALTIAQSLSLPAADFSNCIASTKYDKKIDSAYDKAVTAGATGAPYTIIAVAGHEPIAISGFITYQELGILIDKARLTLNLK